MDILEQCQEWHEKSKFQKIIDALEAIPAGERTPEMDCELARAYNNQGAPEDREMFRKAIALLKPHEAYFQGDHCWNFRMGYAYYYLDQEGPALRYFEQALEARPGDGDTLSYIDNCKDCLALPRFRENFRKRTAKAWEAFTEREAELRRIMDEDKKRERGDELIAKLDGILRLVFEYVSFEVGFNGVKYELTLTPEGNKVKLFELAYFQRHAPASVLEKWNIFVGRQPMEDIGLRSGSWDVSGDDVQVWVEKLDKGSIGLTMYCEKLLPLLQEDERAEWMFYTITDQVLGEIPAMRYIDRFDVVRECREEPSILLTQLPRTLEDMGLDLSTDVGNYLENSYTGYKMEPNEDPEADWRLDTIAGSTNCPALINGYLDGESDYMDDLHADGVAAGFLCYPLDGFGGENRGQKILDFRDRLEAALIGSAGEEAVTLVGGATGIYCGYLDFFAWDLPAVLDAAKSFFEGSGLRWANFHVFRRNAATVPLVSREGEAEEQGESLEGLENIPDTPENADAFCRQPKQWNDDSEGTQCGKALETIPEELEKGNGQEPEDGPEAGEAEDDGEQEERTKPEIYTLEEMKAIERHIERYFGKFEAVFHEKKSPDIHVDLCIVSPTEERNYYTLVTMGMGAHRMNVPEELAEHKLERAELAIALPRDWKLEPGALRDEQWYWPIRLLKGLARLPGEQDTWLGWGHTMDHQEPFAENTKLCASILTGPQNIEDGGDVCTLPNGEEVNFYQVIPLYRDEMEYKMRHNADNLLEKMSGVSFVLRPDRPDSMALRGRLC